MGDTYPTFKIDNIEVIMFNTQCITTSKQKNKEQEDILTCRNIQIIKQFNKYWFDNKVRRQASIKAKEASVSIIPLALLKKLATIKTP